MSIARKLVPLERKLEFLSSCATELSHYCLEIKQQRDELVHMLDALITADDNHTLTQSDIERARDVVTKYKGAK